MNQSLEATARAEREQRDGPRLWRALYAYCHRGRAATDRLVVEAVAPTAKALREQGHVDGWFFIRYWKGGPHVRVRLCGHDPERLGTALQAMREALETFLAHSPPPEEELEPANYYRRFGVEGEEAEALGWYPDGAVREAVYEPEVERYGGPAAMGLAEELFQVSSDVAAAAIARTEGEKERTGVALDLLLGFVGALYDRSADGVRWLREYTIMWRYLDQVVAARSSDVRAAAEATFVGSAPALLGRHAALAERAPGGYRYWWSAVTATMRELRGLERTEGLTAGPEAVMVSQLHMLANRLGLTASDEVYLAWLASFVLSAPGQAAPSYFDDDAAAADRAYHEYSKFRPSAFPAQRPRPGRPIVRTLEFASDEPLELPRPDPDALACPLAEAMAGRRSARGGLSGEVTIEQLSTLLAFGAGIVGSEPFEAGGETMRRGVRAAPSAGMAYPLILRVVPFAVPGLRPVLYEYLPERHSVQQVGGPVDKDALSRCSPFFEGDRPRIDVARTPLLLFVGADLGGLRQRYGLRAHRFAMLEIGHIAQTLLLAGTALGLASVPVGGFYDDAAAELAHLDGYDEVLGYLIPVAGRAGTDVPPLDAGGPLT
ncbi:thiopeptide-type bacteriocin biosynthesis protein [Nocardiopsis sp. NPDC006832]|uniref:thiopeptide-type bacteriocin biosynthesis protein n=1 Tax=Nocardiopsis sp. NPDC006832 TaxID=3157188 RepID=UPI0033D5EF1E